MIFSASCSKLGNTQKTKVFHIKFVNTRLMLLIYYGDWQYIPLDINLKLEWMKHLVKYSGIKTKSINIIIYKILDQWFGSNIIIHLYEKTSIIQNAMASAIELNRRIQKKRNEGKLKLLSTIHEIKDINNHSWNNEFSNQRIA